MCFQHGSKIALSCNFKYTWLPTWRFQCPSKILIHNFSSKMPFGGSKHNRAHSLSPRYYRLRLFQYKILCHWVWLFQGISDVLSRKQTHFFSERSWKCHAFLCVEGTELHKITWKNLGKPISVGTSGTYKSNNIGNSSRESDTITNCNCGDPRVGTRRQS